MELAEDHVVRGLGGVGCIKLLFGPGWDVWATDSCFASSIYHQPGDAPCEDRALWHIFIAANEDQQLRGCRLGTSAFSWRLERRIGFLEICFMITPTRREH